MCTIEGVKNLGVLAARLLALYLLDPQRHPTTEEDMRALGTTRRQSFYAARDQLKRLGFIETHRTNQGVRLSLTTSVLSPSLVGRGGVEGGEGGNYHNTNLTNKNKYKDNININYISILGGSSSGSGSGLNGRAKGNVTESVTSNVTESVISTADIQQKVLHPVNSDVTESVVSQTDITESVTLVQSDVTESVIYPLRIQQKVLHSDQCNVTESVTSVRDTTESVTSLEARCVLVDEMDDTGPETSRKSPFALRRAAQVELIREMWKEVFPKQAYPLTTRNAKQLLIWCENSAVMVLEEIQDIKRKKPTLDEGSPFAYIAKALKGRAEQPREVAQSPSRVGLGAAAYYPGGDLPKPTSKWWDEVKEAKKQAERTKKERNWEE